MCDLDSDIAGSNKDIQRIEPKPNSELSSTERPVCGHESTKSCVLTPKHVENDQTGTERPVLVDQKEEHKIDFRVPGLSHAVVKDAEHLRGQELVKRIENHLYREALHSDLQRNNVYNPFSNNSKAMIRELGNVELFELCETIQKEQCSHCVLYWNQGIVYCTCGQCLVDSESRKKFHKLRLDAHSIPNYVIKKGPYSWCSTWQNRSTKRVPYGLQCVEEMMQESRLSRWTFYRYSRSISQRSSLSWITTRNRMDRTTVQRVGWTCKRRPHNLLPEEKKRYQDNGLLLWTKKAKMDLWSLIWLQSRCLNAPRVRRKSWRANFSRTTQTMVSLLHHTVLEQELVMSSHFF